MADQDTLQKEPVNVLAMSDEELANFDPSTLPVEPVAEDKEEDAGTGSTENVDPAGDEPEDKSGEPTGSTDPEDKDVDPENPDGEPKAEDGEPQGEAERKPEGSTDDKTTDKAEDKPADKQGESQAVDFEANWKALTAPFKANGRDMQIETVEDARALMQMGANYNKKMAALKPNLKILKLLENNKLLDAEKISFLIDLDKKNPDAIGKLIKDSGIDPLDLNADKTSEYKSNTYTVDDREIDLDTVLEEISDSPTYTQTLDVVSNKWDSASKHVIAQTPQLLKLINAHIESGIYDIISKEVDREKMFGRLSGLSDIEAYRQVGDAIQARGGFNHLTRKGEETPAKPVVVPLKPKQADDDKLKEKKRAASSTTPAAPSAKSSDFNPLSLSDEEFSKQVNSKFL